jgi:ent-kaurene oxidase
MIGDLILHPQTLLSAGVVAVILSLLSVIPAWQRARTLKSQRNEGVPIVNLSNDDYKAAEKLYVSDLKNLLLTGYKKFKHGVYHLWSVDGFLSIVSSDYVDELKNLPVDVLDFHAAAQKRMIGQYEWVNLGSDLLAKTVLNDLTKQLGMPLDNATLLVFCVPY